MYGDQSEKFACGYLLSGQCIILQWGSRGVFWGKSNSKDEIIVWEMTLLVWSTDIVGRLGLWPEDKQRRPGVGSRTTWLYHNYYYDSSYKYGHPMSVMEKVAVHIHALNKKVAYDLPVTATILPVASRLTIATKLWHWREDVSSPLQRNVHNPICNFCLKAYCYFLFFIELSLLLNSRLLSYCRPVQKCSLSCCYGFDG